MSGSFQTATHAFQAPGIAGDFASTNPRSFAVGTQWQDASGALHTGLYAGPNGLTIGLFAWLDLPTHSIASNSGAGVPAGFVHRAAEALITTYLNAYGMTIPAGFEVGNIATEGDFYCVNNGTTLAQPGMKAYANNANGQAAFAATGSPTSTAVSASTATITAEVGSSAASTIVDDVFTTGPAVTGLMVVGGTLSGTNVASGTIITAQLTGTAGGAGTYTVFPREQTVASTTISETYGLFAPGTLVSGAFAVGQTLTGSSVTAGTYITAVSATAGDWIVTPTQTAGSETITGYANTETAWYCKSFGQPGEVVIISTKSQG